MAAPQNIVYRIQLDPDFYRPKVVGAIKHPLGSLTATHRLDEAAQLIRSGLGQPLGRQTELDAELYVLLREVIPPTPR